MAMLGISTVYSKAWLVTNAMGAPEILHGSHLSKASFFLPSLMASCMVMLQITLPRGIVYSNLTTLHQT